MKIRKFIPWFFFFSLLILAGAFAYRMMRSDYARLHAAWLSLEAAYIGRVETVIEAENLLSVSSGATLPDSDFIRRTRYQLRFESDVNAKIESVHTFERSYESYVSKLIDLSDSDRLSGLGRYALFVALTEESILDMRDEYNSEVRLFNTKISLFPRNWFAAIFGFDKQGLLSMNIHRISL